VGVCVGCAMACTEGAGGVVVRRWSRWDGWYRVWAGGFRVSARFSVEVAVGADVRRGLSPSPRWPITVFNGSFDASRRALPCIWRMVAPSLRCIASKFQENTYTVDSPSRFRHSPTHLNTRRRTCQPHPTTLPPSPQRLMHTGTNYSTTTYPFRPPKPHTNPYLAHSHRRTLPTTLSYPSTHAPEPNDSSFDASSQRLPDALTRLSRVLR